MLEQKLINFYLSSSFVGFLVEVIFILLIVLFLRNKNSSISIFLEIIYEKMYDFFSEIIGPKQKNWIKSYLVSLFFIILISNFLGLLVEIISPIFGVDHEGNFILEHFITIPSGDINFNLALSIISVSIIIILQFKHLGVKHFFYDYFPIMGKGYIEIERGEKSALAYYPVAFFIKAFDILISLFLGLLEIVGLVAKIISLSFRLFGNMVSGTILLAMTVVGVGALTQDMWSINFPVFLPVIIYLQEILVAFIQALVFPLLVAIFIKVAITTEE